MDVDINDSLLIKGKMAFVCLRKDCLKEFRTASGRSKHHKKCSKERIEKQYKVISSGNYQCKRCDNKFKHLKAGIVIIKSHIELKREKLR